MTENHLEYELQDGYVHNWLVAGPLAIPVPYTGQPAGDDLKLDIARRHHHGASDIHEPPIELASFQIGESELMWRYAKCLDDHLLDLSTTYPTLTYLRSWAYCQLTVPSAHEAVLVLTAYGPADVWVNRTHIYRHEGFAQDGRSVSLPVELESGPNEVLVRFEQVAGRARSAARECPYALALRFVGGEPQAVTTKLPVGHPNVTRRQKLERLYAQAHIERNMLLSGQNPALHWDEVLDESDDIGFFVQDGREHIQISGSWETRPGERLEIGHSQLTLDEGPYHLVLLPPIPAIELFQIVHNERLPFHVLGTVYSDAYYGTYEERCKEALAHAARHEGDLYAEVCKLHMGRWANVDAGLIEEAIAQIDRREEGSEPNLIGLLGALHRYAKTFAWLPDLRRSLERCVLDFSYGHDEPGVDDLEYSNESPSILLHACEILAGQLYPERTFSSAGQNGRWHREKGERLALEWLQWRGTAGFREWDSNDTFERNLLALSHLADLAEDVAVRELAAVVMDKLLFTMAVNSYKGVFGSTHGRTEASMIAGGQLEATSGVTRLMWGMGVWNHHIRALVALACSEYEAPPLIPAIATDLDHVLWARERHLVAGERVPQQGENDASVILRSGSDEESQATIHPGDEPSTYVNKVTYRTADYMLCSAQDYRPGAQGDREHIWQATLGPDAVVFVNHPACMSQSAARRPNFWRGNGVLPRVAQWKDVLVAVHSLPDDGKPADMGFTHAYFPTYEFDEYTFEENARGLRWAFARKGSGYLALAAARGFELLRRGLTAYRELRSYGRQNIWLCMMGRQATDGSFAEFQEAVLALDVEMQADELHPPLNVRCTTPRGERLSFGWEGPLLLDGEEQPLSGYRHYDSPYCVAEMGATEMDIRYGDYTMRLGFE
jgi:hypothetical protein